MKHYSTLFKKALAGTALGLALASCAGPRLLTGSGTTLGSYELHQPGTHHTYYLMSGAFEGDTTARVSLHQEVARQMRLRGFEEMTPAGYFQPDVLVYCSVYEKPFVLNSLQRSNPTSSQEPPTYEKYHTYLHDGAMVLQMFDTRERRVFWVGYANALNLADIETSPANRLTMAAQGVLGQFRLLSSEFPLVRR